METLVDLAPLIDAVLALLVSALLAVGTWGIQYISIVIKQKFGIEVENWHREALKEALENGIAFAQDRLREHTDDVRMVEMRNEFLAHAVGYVVRSVPDALDYMGIDDERVAELIEARLNSYYDVDVGGDPDGSDEDQPVSSTDEPATDPAPVLRAVNS